VNYRLYKKTAAAGAHVAVAPTAMDWVLLVK
jgi:hypothetical protein